MSDLDNLLMLKQMLEQKTPTEQEDANAREKRFFSDVMKVYLEYTNNDMNGIQSYNPEQLIAFIKTAGNKLQRMLGGEWTNMDSWAFDALSYTVIQKMQKSASLLDWNS